MKTQPIFIIVGIVILAGIGYFVFKPAHKQETRTAPSQQITGTGTPNTIIEPSMQIDTPVEVILDYKKDIPQEAKVTRITEGQKVTIKATADVSDEVHFHGYDLSANVKPGEVATIHFTADKTGRFPIELESLKKEIGIIEVYPK